MFDHATHEKLDSIAHDLHTLLSHTGFIMASLQEVKDAQAAETQAIQELTARLAAQPPAAATAAELDPILATAQANTAALNELANPQPAPPAPAA